MARTKHSSKHLSRESVGHREAQGHIQKYAKETGKYHCSCATVTLGHEGGVAKLLTAQSLSKVVVWRYLNRRLQLSVDDSVREVSGMSYFKVP
jgi:hypothetical protein